MEEPVDTDKLFADFNIMATEHLREAAIKPTDRVARVDGDAARRHPLSGIEQGQEGARAVLLVPQVTPEDTARGISSNGKRMVQIAVPENVSPGEFRSALAAAYMEYVISGSVTVAGVSERSSLNTNRISLIFAAPEFKTALQVRGVVTTPNAGITAEQDYALQIVLDTSDGLTFGRKLQKAGVSNSKWQAWLKNPLFASHYQRVSDGLLNDNKPGMIQLAMKAGEGDLAAIKFMWEVNRFHNPQVQQQVDVMVMMNRIMEVLARNVEPAQLAKIATEMREIGESVGLANRTIIGS